MVPPRSNLYTKGYFEKVLLPTIPRSYRVSCLQPFCSFSKEILEKNTTTSNFIQYLQNKHPELEYQSLRKGGNNEESKISFIILLLSILSSFSFTIIVSLLSTIYTNF